MTVTIPLTKGYTATIDAIDADLATESWCADVSSNSGNVYAQRRNRGTTARLHRVVMARVLGRELKFWEKVDHVDLNGLNNCRSNLRLATNSQNMANQTKTRRNTSGYKGVSWDKQRRKWVAYIHSNGKSINLGGFNSPEAAHEAYIQAAHQHFGEYARCE